MKKGYEIIVKAIEVTKKYTNEEVKQLSGLFIYLNSLDIDEEGFGTGVSAKGLWKLLNPLTRTGKSQPFREWWESVSNLSRLKENIDYERKEIIKKISNKKIISTTSENSQTSKSTLNYEEFEVWENPQTSKSTLNKSKGGKRDFYGTKEIDYILTLRAGEYCAVLTKGDSGDLYRRFIFDIKDEFLRLVFRKGKSIETRSEFTKSIGELFFMKQLKYNNSKELGNIYGEMTNLIYLELFGVKAIEYKQQNDIPNKYFAKDFFTKEGLFDLEKVENKLGAVILYIQPNDKEKLKELIIDFLNKEVKISV